jgi:hypothetical protein
MTDKPHATMSPDELALELFTSGQSMTGGRAEAERLLQQIKDRHAHQLAEQQRNHFGVGDAPVLRAHCDPDCDFCQGVTSAADLIDPEVKR